MVECNLVCVRKIDLSIDLLKTMKTRIYNYALTTYHGQCRSKLNQHPQLSEAHRDYVRQI